MTPGFNLQVRGNIQPGLAPDRLTDRQMGRFKFEPGQQAGEHDEEMVVLMGPHIAADMKGVFARNLKRMIGSL